MLREGRVPARRALRRRRDPRPGLAAANALTTRVAAASACAPPLPRTAAAHKPRGREAPPHCAPWPDAPPPTEPPDTPAPDAARSM